MIADIFGAETVPVKGEGAALGAAIHARWVWEKTTGQTGQSLSDLTADYIEYDESHRKRPSKALEAYYTRLKKLYHALSERIQGRDSEDPFLLRAELLQENQ